MIPAALVKKPISQLQLAPGSLLSIPNVSWDEFEAILKELGNHRALQVTYFEQTLELMGPLQKSWKRRFRWLPDGAVGRGPRMRPEPPPPSKCALR
jgi:hypothetical protein